jgi:membrane associated rhomboid family serine protease
VQRKEYYRIVSGGFLHADYGHLTFNMLSFYFFGDAVNADFREKYSNGDGMFVLLYVAALVVSSLPDVLKRKNNRYYGSIGASGAVSAVIFSAIWLNPLNKVYLFGVVAIPGFIFGGVYLLYSKYMAKQPGRDNVNHDAHFYGSVFGVLFPLVTSPDTFMNFVESVSRFRL